MSAKKDAFRNVPSPAGAKAGTAYTRFIPREELGEVASWRPGTFGARSGGTSQAAQSPAAEPNAAEWHKRVQAARQTGYQDGYRDGLAALENFKQQFATQATAQIGTLLEAFDRQLAALDGQLADVLARSALQLAREVVRSELAVRPALVAQVASEALAAVMLSARYITVHAHPQDLPLIAEGAEETLAARGARLLADATVERGGVRLLSDVGTVDAGIGTRWAQAAESIGVEPWIAAAATLTSLPCTPSMPSAPPPPAPFAAAGSDAEDPA